MEKIRVLILTEGGGARGLGHVARCLALSQMCEEKGMLAEMFIRGNEKFKMSLKDSNYCFVDWLNRKREIYELIKKNDVVIVDSYEAGIDFYSKISTLAKVSVYIDDFCRLNYPKGIVINPSLDSDRLVYSRREGVIYLLGKDYVILRKPFWAVPFKVINFEVKNILITFGACDYYNLVKNIVTCLEERLGEGVNFNVIKPEQGYLDAERMLELMLKADICITAGGQTTNELARVGVPAIGICLARNQIVNLQGGQRLGSLDYVGWFNEQTLLEKVTQAVISMLPYSERVRRNNLCGACLDGNGASRITDSISQLLKRARV